MISGIIITVAIIMFLTFFIIYKKNMLSQLFSMNIKSSTEELQEEIEQTAAVAVQRLEEQVAHLENLLQVSNSKIFELNDKINEANKILERYQEVAAVNIPQSDELVLQNEIHINDSNVEPQKEFKNDKHAIIFDMAKKGVSITEIAKNTGIGKGEITLLLNLHKK